MATEENLPLVFTKVANQKDEFYEGYFNKESTAVVIKNDGKNHIIKGSFRFKRSW
jgi:hypothetical protein